MTVLGIAGLVALGAAGMVLALSWAVDFPATVLSTAWLIAVAAAVTVAVASWRDSRRRDVTMAASFGNLLRDLWRFVLAFF